MFKRIAIVALASVLATSALADNLAPTGAREQSGEQSRPQSRIGQLP
jgi:hypothetical protein